MPGAEIVTSGRDPFWQRRYYDRNIHSAEERVNALRYMHRNPVKRGFGPTARTVAWSSFLHHATGAEGVVEIESDWTARKRERMGIVPTVCVLPPHPFASRKG